MKEVSCRLFGLGVYAHEKLGIPKEKLLMGVPYDWEYLCNPRNRVDWDEWLIMTENAAAAIGSDNEFAAISKEWALVDSQKAYTRLAGFFVSLNALYVRLVPLMIKSIYTVVIPHARQLPDGTFEMTMEIAAPYTASRNFMLGGACAFSTFPCLIGLPPARVEQEITDRRGVYRIYPPPEKTLWRRLRVLPGTITASLSFFRILREQHTELTTSYQQLEQQTTNLRNVLTASSDGIAVVREGRIVHANPALARLLRAPGINALIGQPTDTWTSTEDLQNLRAWAATKPSATERREVRMLRTTKEAIPVEFSAPRTISWENQPAVLWSLRDISERRALEQALATARQREQASLARDLHDGLGQHLTGLAYKLKALETRLAITSSPESAAVTEMIAIANQATTQARDLAHGLSPVDIDPQGLAPALRHLAGSTSQLFQLHCTFACEGPLLTLPGNTANQLYHATQEAITNAHRHGRAKTISVLLRTAPGELTLLVDDDGTGLPADFDPAHMSGMGLKIMRHRLSSIDGRFCIEKSPTLGGSRVKLSAPFKPEPNVINQPAVTAFEARPTPTRAWAATWRVLLVDDHAVVRAGLGQLLNQTHDFTLCGEASTPAEAETACRDLLPDLLITDLLFGEESALETIRRIRVEHATLGIVALSMYGKEHYEEASRAAGADAYVMKHAAADELLATIRRVCAERNPEL
jgi:PAS domain S-box-containing protein